MKAIKLTDDIYFVGGIDYSVRDFHGYETTYGTSYNCYLIMDEKITLIDSVKKPLTAEMLERISSVIDPSKIDIIISNHAEFDHSGGIKTISELSNAKVYATAAGVKSLTNMYGEMDYVAVKAGEKLCTGKYEFTFLPTPMVHWPDNMVTYLESQEILFSNDAFGQHVATNALFDTKSDVSFILNEAKKYYANIVLPYAPQVGRASNAVKSLKLKMIAPSHGIIWTDHIADIVSLYDDMLANKKSDTAVIVYDTMWGNTEAMAREIGAAFEEVCQNVKYYKLSASNMSDIVTEMMSAKYVAVGSPTLNNGLYPAVAKFLCYAGGLKPQNLSYVSFGSFGWAGGAIKEINASLDKLGYNKIAEYGVAFKPQAPLDVTPILELKQ